MKRFLINLILAGILTGCSTLDSVLNRPEVTILEPMPDTIRIAVPDFQVSGNGLNKKSGSLFAGYLTESWITETRTRAVDRSLVERWQKKNVTATGGLLSPGQMSDLSGSLDAGCLVAGSVRISSGPLLYDPENQSEIQVSLRWIHPEDGRLLALGLYSQKSSGNPELQVRDMIREIIQSGNWFKKEIKTLPADTSSVGN
ncbi:MAG: hypothetical protein L6Q77_13325 [Bacteroidetes bacterium]|nr:hypothetical protein [Bacteroidota bacterium]